jgi:hypothetical protein
VVEYVVGHAEVRPGLQELVARFDPRVL